MRGLQKSKRVSWASDVNLCQVRLFLSDESPSQVGLDAQDHLQAKASWLPHSTGMATDDILPPGFEGGQPPSQLQIRVSEIPLIKWRCPPRFVLNSTWRMAAGGESKEVEIQNQREMRVLEAVYPRPSAIPSNPTFSVDMEGSQYNDHQITLIPITPIEDEDAADSPSDLKAPPLVPRIPAHIRSIPSISNVIVNEKPTAGLLRGVEPDTVAAASAAFAAINKGNEQGSLIDHDFLVKILSNPKLIEKLVTDYGAASNVQNTPKPTSSLVPLSDPPLPPVHLKDASHLQMSGTESSSPSSLSGTSSGPFYSQPTNGVGLGIHPNVRVAPLGVPAPSAPSIGPPQAKDVNYYKNLIQQHGGDRQEAPQQFGSRYNHQLGTNQELVNPKSRDLKPKIMKPCIYFNSSRGCRHGANCAYQHDASSQQRGSSIPEVQSAKRMKMDREISS